MARLLTAIWTGHNHRHDCLRCRVLAQGTLSAVSSAHTQSSRRHQLLRSSNTLAELHEGATNEIHTVISNAAAAYEEASGLSPASTSASYHARFLRGLVAQDIFKARQGDTMRRELEDRGFSKFILLNIFTAFLLNWSFRLFKATNAVVSGSRLLRPIVCLPYFRKQRRANTTTINHRLCTEMPCTPIPPRHTSLAPLQRHRPTTTGRLVTRCRTVASTVVATIPLLARTRRRRVLPRPGLSRRKT